MIPPLILELSAKINRRAALLLGVKGDPAQSSEDLSAHAWMKQSLEDVEVNLVRAAATCRAGRSLRTAATDAGHWRNIEKELLTVRGTKSSPPPAPGDRMAEKGSRNRGIGIYE